MITRAQQLRDVASECRSISALSKDPQVREQMLSIADQLERLAQLRDYPGVTVPQDGLQHGSVEEVSEPSHHLLKDLLADWLTKRGSGIAPSRSAIPLEEVSAFIPNLSLIDVVGDPPRFRYRYCETRVSAGFGQSITGKFLDELDLGSGSLKTDLASVYTRMMREGRPQVARVRLRKRDGRQVKYERVALPLSEDGKAVNTFLLAYVFDREAVN